jgi:hypothetical protein
MFLVINENIYFQSCHISRDNTQAGFESAPLLSVEKGCPTIMRDGPPLNAVGAAHTTHPGLLSTLLEDTCVETELRSV